MRFDCPPWVVEYHLCDILGILPTAKVMNNNAPIYENKHQLKPVKRIMWKCLVHIT